MVETCNQSENEGLLKIEVRISLNKTLFFCISTLGLDFGKIELSITLKDNGYVGTVPVWAIWVDGMSKLRAIPAESFTLWDIL